MNSVLANIIGRPDLTGVPVDPYGGSSGVSQVGAVGGGSSLSVGLEGRLTAGVLIVFLLGVGAFYVWTRGVQA